MEYSVNQINNLLRTYPQHLKVRPTLREEDASASRDPGSEEVINIAISLGVASTGTPDVTRKEDLIRAADAALYRAKEAGRNRWFVAHGDEVFRYPQDEQPRHHDPAFSHH